MLCYIDKKKSSVFIGLLRILKVEIIRKSGLVRGGVREGERAFQRFEFIF